MSGLLYMMALVLVPWLVVWTIRDPNRPSPMWWPFAMKGDPAPARGHAGVTRRGFRAPDPSAAAAEPPADAPRAPDDNGPPVSRLPVWRRAQATAPGARVRRDPPARGSRGS